MTFAKRPLCSPTLLGQRSGNAPQPDKTFWAKDSSGQGLPPIHTCLWLIPGDVISSCPLKENEKSGVLPVYHTAYLFCLHFYFILNYSWFIALRFGWTAQWLSYTHVQFSSIAQSCPPLCYPMGCSTPGLPVYHQLPEFTQTHVHWVGDAIQPSHPLLTPSSPALNLSQHQSLFKWVSSLHQVAKVLEFQLQYQSFQWSPLGWTGWISLLSKGLSRVFSQLKSISSLVVSFLYSPTLISIHDYWKNHSLDLTDLWWQSNVSAFKYTCVCIL